MDKAAKTFDDVFYALYFEENIFPLSVKEVDRSAIEIISEVERYKKEKRQAKKRFSSVECSAATGGGDLIIQINSVKARSEIERMLEGDFPMPEEVQSKLGISVNHNKISLWNRRHIQWQACAQTLWFFDSAAGVKEIQNKMLNDQKLYELLELGILTSLARADSRGRGLEDVIRLVRPTPGRKGPSIKKRTPSPQGNEVELVRGAYDSSIEKIHCKGMKLAIITISQVLALQNQGIAEIFHHPTSMRIELRLRPYLRCLSIGG